MTVLTFREDVRLKSTILSLRFVEDLPGHPGCTVLDRADLSQLGRDNEVSIDAWGRALAAKFGPPRPSTRWWGGLSGPSLEDGSFYGTFVLRLWDQVLTKAMEAARSKMVSDAKPVARPRL